MQTNFSSNRRIIDYLEFGSIVILQSPRSIVTLGLLRLALPSYLSSSATLLTSKLTQTQT